MGISIAKGTSRGNEYVSLPTQLYTEKRAIFVTGPVNDAMAESVIMQLLCLDDSMGEPATLVINSPGGSVSAGLAIVDAMEEAPFPVHTHATGCAASMGATILACGEPGHRTASPHAEILIHQPLMYGQGGQASDIAIAAAAVLKTRDTLNALLAEKTGKGPKEIEAATDRDNWMSAAEAAEFGLIDRVASLSL